MHTPFKAVAATVLLGLAVGCNNGSSGTTTDTNVINLANSKLQLAVGTATFPDGSINLNAVATFRQPNGLAPVLLDTPLLTGPAGFAVPSTADAGTDAGTNHISGSPPTKTGQTPVASTFGQAGGVFAYGFEPNNTAVIAAPSYLAYGATGDGAPFYAAQFTTFAATPGWPFPCAQGDCVPFLGGPPFYPYSANGTYPVGFNGFPEGFTTFAVKPVAGAYTLSVNVPSGGSSGTTIRAPGANLSSLAGLGPFPVPSFAEDGAGGGTVSINAPGGATETIVNIVDITTPAFYTLELLAGTSTEGLPKNLGPAPVGTTAPSLKAGDTYIVTAIGFDYPAFEAAPPANIMQTPAIAGTNGQADLTISPFLEQVYGGGAPALNAGRGTARAAR